MAQHTKKEPDHLTVPFQKGMVTCAKCTSDDLEMLFCRGGFRWAEDCLIFKCNECRYRWDTLTADSEPSPHVEPVHED